MAEQQASLTGDFIGIAREITVAWLGNPNVNASAGEVPNFLKAMHATITELSSGVTTETAEAPAEFVPAVPVRTSVKPEFIISLIDGRKFKTLKRHLALNGLTPAEYRERYGLKPDYPMVAAAYSEHRREVARKLGLGRKPAAAAAQAAPDPIADVAELAPAKPKRGPAKSRTVKAAVSTAKPAEAKTALEQRSVEPAGVSEAVISEVVPTPAKSKRASAKPRPAKVTESPAEPLAIPPVAKKPRAVLKPQYLPKAEDASEAAAATPKRRWARKQPVEA